MFVCLVAAVIGDDVIDDDDVDLFLRNRDFNEFCKNQEVGTRWWWW